MMQAEVIRMLLHERIKEQRKQSGLSQEKVAELVGVSRQAVTKWETGESRPSTENLFKLAEIFGTTVDLLLVSEDKNTSPAEEIYYFYKMEEEKRRAALQRKLRRDFCLALAVVGGYCFIYLLGRLIGTPDGDYSLWGWLTGQGYTKLPYLFGWLLSSGLYWIAMLISAVPALLGKWKFALATLGGFALSLPIGEYLGRYPKGEAIGQGHYGWLIWGIVFLLSAILGVLLENNVFFCKKMKEQH